MPLTVAAHNVALDAIPVTHVSINSGATPDSANTIGSRLAISFTAAANGERVTSTAVQFNITATVTVASVGLWSASTGGTLLGTVDVTDRNLISGDTYTVNSGAKITLTATA